MNSNEVPASGGLEFEKGVWNHFDNFGKFYNLQVAAINGPESDSSIYIVLGKLAYLQWIPLQLLII